ncbi:DUF3995 domain-containing protein [Olivibacter sp. SDN3]|uniref:DUF3995 domain-containing protein n=1 Tax=Olivibacter sp. SDN3 TaxID=2764720 RepID=UPI001650E40C|nr:DUF3995 domain-containing protein [Olivibacter sp. SDN3]QNL51030.1 DUF3995 domain-containing protein [Olivibacter sp. SDN3]
MEQYLPFLNAFIFLVLASVHFYWAFGGRWAFDVAIPTDVNGRHLFRPNAVNTLMVAIGLLGFAAVNLVYAGWIYPEELAKEYIRFLMASIAFIFALRAMGDFRYIGFTKRRSHYRTSFGKRDTKLYSPLCLLLAFSHLFVLL